MGTVHARSLEPLPSSGPDFGELGEEAEFVEVEPEAKQEILENKDVVVQHVHFDGLGRTKDDIIICEIGDVFKAKNLIEAELVRETEKGLPSVGSPPKGRSARVRLGPLSPFQMPAGVPARCQTQHRNPTPRDGPVMLWPPSLSSPRRL